MAALSLAAGGLFLGVAYLLWDPYSRDPARGWNRGRNAIWLRHVWLAEPHGEEEVHLMLGNLRDLGIQTVFPHLAPMTRAGEMPPWSVESAALLVRIAREGNPALRVMPWVGGVVTGHRGDMPGTVDLGDPDQRRTFAAACRSLVLLGGFDGVHVNVEPIPSGSPEFLALLHGIREALPPGTVLSVAAARPSTFNRWNPRPHHSWDPGYYAAVAPFVDQMAVMTYDTGIPLRKWYVHHIAENTRTIAEAIHRSNPSCRLLMGVPTYTRLRFAQVENLLTALRGIARGLEETRPPAREIFDGVAVYAEWTTDAAEWDAYRTEWLGQPRD